MGLPFVKQAPLMWETNDTSAIIAGVDEVGRGPLVGNVVTAAVILPEGYDRPLNDSKKLSAKKREALADRIREEAEDFHIAYATPKEIDDLNILHATMLAMQRAVKGLSKTFDEVWVDGNRCPHMSTPCKAIVKGDGLVTQISAASILAKVARDEEMMQLHKAYPEYGFSQHKGYPTVAHLAAIERLGVLEMYRTSFAPVQRLLMQRPSH